MKPYNLKIEEPELYVTRYVLRKDNVLVYRGNYYSVPLGTYRRGIGVLVARNEETNQLEIYSEGEFKLLAVHEILTGHGKASLLPEHGHEAKTKATMAAEAKFLEIVTPVTCNDVLTHDAQRLLKAVENGKPRYYRKALEKINHELAKYDPFTLSHVLMGILEDDIKGVNDMIEYIDLWLHEGLSPEERAAMDLEKNLPAGINPEDITPEKRSLNEYSNLFDQE